VIVHAAPPRVRGSAIQGTRYLLVLPSACDPRLHLAAVVVSLQVPGTSPWGFGLSIAES
jgi:hypothetical protein